MDHSTASCVGEGRDAFPEPPREAAGSSLRLHMGEVGAKATYAREALELYLRRNPRMGDVPLFPAPGRSRKKKGALQGPEKPNRRETAAKWLVTVEELAGLPELVGGVFHPYRRLWATERKDLPLVDVAAAGGWKDTQALRLSYQHADAETVLRVVEGRAEGGPGSALPDTLWTHLAETQERRRAGKPCGASCYKMGLGGLERPTSR